MKKDQIKELEELILLHKKLYYTNQSEIGDDEYDALEEQLRTLDPDNKVFSMVGTDFFTTEKIPHSQKMLSLDKTYIIENLIKWQKNKPLLAMFKIDGVSASLIYDENLKLAKTRGDGSFGENISEVCSYISDIPNELKFSGEIRGEIYCKEKDFELLKKEMEDRGLDSPKSMRNIVAGILGRKKDRDLAKFLSFFAFDILDFEQETELELFSFLEDMKFKTPPYQLVACPIEIEHFLNKTKSFLSEGNYLIDGSVFSYNDRKIHKDLGSTSHHPKYKMAFKFKGESTQTVINDIRWNISPRGKYTPVAIVETVELSGANISNVTLHNFKTVKAFKLAKGTVIEIIRSGEIIPKFLRVVKESSEDIKFPENCTFCQSRLEIDEINLVCCNAACSGRNKHVVLKFIEKMKIRDLSEKRLDLMIENNMVSGISSLYKLKVDDLLKLEGFKNKLANKIIENIEKSKKVSVVDFFSALSFDGGAKKNTERCLANECSSLQDFFKLKKDDLLLIDGFAEIKAEKFIQSIQENKILINELISLGVELVFPNVKIASEDAKTVCITGSLSTSRKDIEEALKASGFKISSSVNNKTDILICNEKSSSSKYKKAISLGKDILTEEEFKKRFKVSI